MQPGDQLTGIVVSWIDKGEYAFGFIEVPGAARDVYVSADRLVGFERLYVGQKVGFTIERRLSGRVSAVNVHLATTAIEVRAPWQLRR